eukprot:8151928-Alexandrium_andersonii.AAC.1
MLNSLGRSFELRSTKEGLTLVPRISRGVHSALLYPLDLMATTRSTPDARKELRTCRNVVSCWWLGLALCHQDY